MLTDGRATDAGVTGTLIAHLGAFGSGELIRKPRIPHFFRGVSQPIQESLGALDRSSESWHMRYFGMWLKGYHLKIFLFFAPVANLFISRGHHDEHF